MPGEQCTNGGIILFRVHTHRRDTMNAHHHHADVFKARPHHLHGLYGGQKASLESNVGSTICHQNGDKEVKYR